MNRHFLFLLAVALLLPGCKTFEQGLMEQGYRRLQGEELIRTFVGNTDYTSSGEYWYYREDGKISGTSKSGRSIDGKWKVNEGGTICIDWNDQYLPSGCSKYFVNDETGEVVWLEPDGQNSRANIQPGNPRNFR
ncbi:MAG: hypothetical protein FDZ69_11415 [Deltaproteobacteria bacterium]|nr:MAG: hypothetical protein FDZ69_11415 [Deltaproteobacteria bacterium]